MNLDVKRSITICSLTLLLLSGIFLPVYRGADDHKREKMVVKEDKRSKSEILMNSNKSLADAPWPMFHQNLNHTGRSEIDTGYVDGTVKWSRSIGDAESSDLVVANNGSIYVCGNTGIGHGYLYKIHKSGNIIWEKDLGAGSYVVSCPALTQDGSIYVSSTAGNLYGIKYDGNINWTFSTGKPLRSSPAIGKDGTVYFGSDDGNLYAIYPNGTERWSFSTPELDPIRSSPCIGEDGTIYVGSQDGYLYAINPDGSSPWAYLTGGSIYSSPAIGATSFMPEGAIYVGSDDGDLYSIDLSGNKLWKYPTMDFIRSSPAIREGNIYVGSTTGDLLALNLDGSINWSYSTGAPIVSSPAIGADGTIYVGSNDSYMYAFKPNGDLKWNVQLDAPITRSPTIGHDGTVYITSNAGTLYALSGTPSAPTNISAAVKDRNVNLSWDPPSEGAHTIEEYRIYGGNSTSNMSFIGNTTSNRTYYLQENLTEGSKHHYKVSAVNSCGEGPNSTEVQKTIPSVPPSIVDKTPSDPSTDNSFTFRANVTDKTSIENVNVYYSTDVNGPFNQSMNEVSNSIYEADILIPAEATILNYNISSNDTLGNWNQTGENVLTIDDTIQPTIENVSVAPQHQSIGDPINISCDVNDNWDIDTVKVNITLPDGTSQNISMFHPSGSRYYYNSTFNDSGQYHYKIWARDGSANVNKSITNTFSIEGNISDIQASPSPQEIGQSVNLTCNITISQVMDAWANITTPSGELENKSMCSGNGKTWYNRSVYNELGTFSYMIEVKNVSGDWTKTSSYDFVIEDTTIPIIDNVSANPSSQTLRGPVNITADVSDNYALSEVSLRLTYPNGTMMNRTMASTFSETFYSNLSFDIPGTYNYSIMANDTSGNNAVSAEENFTVQDVREPRISNVTSTPSNLQIDGSVNISCDISDNHMVSDVWLNLTYPSGYSINISMNNVLGQTYFYNRSYDSSGPYSYSIICKDQSSNWNSSQERHFYVNGNISRVSADPENQESGGYVNVSCDISLYELEEIWLNITYPDSSEHNKSMLYDGTSYFYNSSYTLIGQYDFNISVKNSSGIWTHSAGYNFTIIDAAPPKIDNVSADPMVQLSGKNVNLSCSVTDDQPVEDVFINITRPDGSKSNYTCLESSDHIWYHNRSYNTAGDYGFIVWAVDQAGNWNHSETYTFQIMDGSPPVIKNVSAWPSVQEPGGCVNLTSDVYDPNLEGVYVNISYPGGESYNRTMDNSSSSYYYNSSFDQMGNYTYAITAGDSWGNWNCSTHHNFSIKDIVAPIADAGEDLVIDMGETVHLDASNTSDNVGVVNYTWLIEETKYYGEVVNHTFEEAGDKTVKLNVSDSTGNHDIDTLNVTVRDIESPDAEAGVDRDISVREEVEFAATSSTDNVAIVNYTWSIDSMNLYGEVCQYSFPEIGTYEVFLNVTDASGNYATDSLTVTVYDHEAPITELKNNDPVERVSTTSNITLNFTASDNGNLKSIELWHRLSEDDRETWTDWTLFTERTLNDRSCTVKFDISVGKDGTHEFYTLGEDRASNMEDVPEDADVSLIVDTSHPSVKSTYPVGGQVQVSIYTNISLTFSESMNLTSLKDAFSIQPFVTGNLRMDSSTLIFVPKKRLDPETIYQVKLGKGAKDIHGLQLEDKKTFSFTTEEDDPPTLDITNPVKGETYTMGEPLNINWSATDDHGLEVGSVDITVSLSNHTRVSIATDIQNNGSYEWVLENISDRAIINISITDCSGQTAFVRSPEFSISRPVGSLVNYTLPTSNSTGIEVGTTIQIKYHKAIDPDTADILVISEGSKKVEGSYQVGSKGKVLEFVPSEDLKPETEYTVMVVVEDTSGNSIDEQWEFTTGAGKTSEKHSLLENVLSYWWLLLMIVVSAVVGLIFVLTSRDDEDKGILDLDPKKAKTSEMSEGAGTIKGQKTEGVITDRCTICLGEFTEDTSKVNCPNCGTAFHKEGIEELEECPLCGEEINGKKEY